MKGTFHGTLIVIVNALAYVYVYVEKYVAYIAHMYIALYTYTEPPRAIYLADQANTTCLESLVSRIC